MNCVPENSCAETPTPTVMYLEVEPLGNTFRSGQEGGPHDGISTFIRRDARNLARIFFLSLFHHTCSKKAASHLQARRELSPETGYAGKSVSDLPLPEQ